MQLLKPAWVNHDGDKAIFSVDIHPDGSRFATGGQGQDSSGRVVIWKLQPVESEIAEQNEKIPKLLCQLDQHLGCVNSVRWSKSGRLLASAGDDKAIIIWQQSGYGGGTVFGSNVINVESWRIVSTLRGHQGDILDIAWSPDDIWLASASVDNTVIIWNATKWPEQVRILKGHTGMVKGVTWDPVGRYLASQADDKSLRIWRTSNWALEQKITDPYNECGGTTTVLRPSWSPDGQYLVSAHAMNNGGPTAQIIERDGWNTDKDFVGHRKAITCVRFNPNILKKQEGKQNKPVQYCCVAIGSRDRSISIWFTSLKRPLVVIHDIFEDSVLDLSWSKCGRYLMAVSKDGTLAFINFSATEIGKPLTVDEMVALHVKLYGNSAFNANTAVTTSIIENPELLKLQDEAKKEDNLNKINNVEEKKASAPMGPTNKQIEMRTADGRRRITPMFIPPSAEGPSNCKPQETSFSSSRQEKSKIIIEKVDGIVEPNVSSPTKNSNKSSSSMDQILSAPDAAIAMTQPDLDAVPAGLSARIEGPPGALSPGKVTVTVPVKRKADDQHFGHKKKRGRGRPPLLQYERLDSTTPQPSRPASPVAPVEVPKQVTTIPATRPQIVYNRHILNMATMSKSSRIQIPHSLPAPDGCSAMLIIENDWRVSERVSSSITGPLPSLHRVSRFDNGETKWAIYLSSQIRAAVATKIGAAVACQDSSMHLIDILSGEYLFPPIQLHGKPSQLFVQELYLIVLTTDAMLSIWDFANKKRVMLDSVRHLVEGRGNIKSIQIIGDEDTPILVFDSGEAFSWYKDLETWVQLGESAGVRKYIGPEFSILKSCHLSTHHSPLTGILMQTASYSGSSRLGFSSVISGDVKQGLTEAFLKRMITSAQHLNSSSDYKFWFKRLVKFYTNECMETKLRKLFDELLGPIHSGSTVSDGTSWSIKIMNMNKHELLEEVLKQILLADNSIKFQRLHTEYQEQLKGMSVDAI